MMIRVIVLVLVFGSFSFQSLAQSGSKRAMLRELKEDIGYLSSDALEGRRTGSKGATLAAQYLIQRYEALQIPAFEHSYKQPFTFSRGREWGNTTISISGNELELGEEIFPLPFSGNAAVSETALINVKEQGGTWILPLFEKEEEAENPHFDAEKSAWTRADLAAKAGAKAVLFYDEFGAKYPLKYNPKSELDVLSIPVVFVGNKEWKERTKGDVNFLELDLDVQLETKKLTGYNVAAFIDNHRPLTVVLGAHYDHLGHGEDGGSLYTGKVPQIHNGADDNASGTAALIQLGKWLKKSKLRNYNYLLLHFSGEELGLLGSKAFSKKAGIDSTHIAYMINMDMVGRLVDSTKTLTLGGVGSAPSWGNVVKSLERDGFNLKIDSSGIGPSDHTSFYEKGIPVLFFFTGTHSDYHKPSDDADKINYPGEVMVIRSIEKIVADLDASPRPRYTKTKNSGLGRVSFKVTLGIMPDYSWEGEGLRIDGIIDNRPAQKAGLLAGDIIVQLGKDKIKGIQTYMEALSHEQEGAKTKVVVLRAGQQMIFPIDL